MFRCLSLVVAWLALQSLAFAQPVPPKPDVISGCVAIEAYGGNGNGSTDNLSAWNSAISHFGNRPICISFGLGTYRFSGSATATVGSGSSIAVHGAGSNVTKIVFTGATEGFNFKSPNEEAVQIDNMAVLSATANIHDAITVDSSDCTGSKQSSHFSNLTIEGAGSFPFTNHWGRGLVLNKLSFVDVDSVDFFGDKSSGMQGIFAAGNAAGHCYAFNLMVSKSNFIGTANGIMLGTLFQGLFVTQSNFTGGGSGIVVPPSEAEVDQINVSDSSFNVKGDAIATASPITGLYVTHNTIEVPNLRGGVHINGGGSLFVVSENNFFNPNGTSKGLGVIVDSAARLGTITGNVYQYLRIANSLGSSTIGWNIQSNAYGAKVSIKNANSGKGNTIGGGSP
ncbi:hypothetical protein ACFSQT_16630 [Mesorhizobium calcicola]|uniref:Pectate lyase superfamily protein domain-containing protein n=1 Tax=Mesorhizobium calcicola TaxID=1300310 RepID=A0ABW4WDU6_9HYPH